MHEMGIVAQVIKIALAALPEGTPPPQVHKVRLRVGRLSGVVVESLRFCFDVAIRGTALAGAALEVEDIPAMAACRSCGHTWIVAGLAFSCPACAGTGFDLVSGRELEVDCLEVAE